MAEKLRVVVLIQSESESYGRGRNEPFLNQTSRVFSFRLFTYYFSVSILSSATSTGTSRLMAFLSSGSRTKFFVHVAGKTNGAHHELVDRIKWGGHVEVTDPDSCDYMLVFCPVASRVGTDVGETVENLPADKRTVLVVMHHTHNRSAVIAESIRLVNKPNVFTVDILFYEGELLTCDLNDEAWQQIQRHLETFRDISPSQCSVFWRIFGWCRVNWKPVLGVTSLMVILYFRYKPNLLPFIPNAEQA
ncbi:uncharacterized protein V6R79_019520 [Siganus canaliculatus]